RCSRSTGRNRLPVRGALDVRARDGTCHTSPRRPAARDEPVQRAEGAQRRDADKVKSRHAALKPATQNGNRPIRSDLIPQRRIDYSQPTQVYLVSRCEEDVIHVQLCAIRESDIDFAVYGFTFRNGPPLVQRDLSYDPIP